MINSWYMVLGAILGILTGIVDSPALLATATEVANVIKRLLELLSVPIIFLSITTAISGMTDKRDAACLGTRVMRYTVLTTLLAGIVGILLFVFIKPVVSIANAAGAAASIPSNGFADFLRAIVPTNIIFALSSNSHVASVVFLALLLGFATLALEEKQKKLLHQGFSTLFALMMQVTHFILALMPLGVWAFTALFVRSLVLCEADGIGLGLYVITVLAANVLQGCVVLPVLLWMKGLSPRRLLNAFKPALTTAFFSKSSNAALPVTIKCAEERAKISPTISKFVLPLCATINMNGCAAFILITILFVGSSHGMVFSGFDMVMWLLIATIAAVGNAGVPMGCFFLTSAFLAHLQLPVQLMGVILPVYALIDMVETALNVWSDSCVTTMVNEDHKRCS
ncbi:MAG: dicarboxylate/amino acid:cation symporter [Candidatus Dependentiae bacterium]|jgi:Na+/H+-dicarboxylate symporter